MQDNLICGLPKSRVMPLSLLWGFLSKEAVDAVVLMAFAENRGGMCMCMCVYMYNMYTYVRVLVQYVYVYMHNMCTCTCIICVRVHLYT